MRVRFGEVDSSVERRIAGASAADLDRWLERVLTAAGPRDIFEP